MSKSIRILAAFWISGVFLAACGTPAPSLRMLDQRAGYDDIPTGQLPELKEAGLDGFQSGPVPIRTRAKVAACYFAPHEMASHDYFWGAWVSVVYEQDQWTLTEPKSLPRAEAFSDITHRAVPRARVRKPNAMPQPIQLQQ